MRGQAGRRQMFDRALLRAVIGVAVVVPALRRRGARAAMALMVVGSVAVVGYLPSTLASSPGQNVEPARPEHVPSFSAVPFVSTDVVVSVMSDCTSCHDVTAESYPPKHFPPIPHRTEGWGECSFCHAPARLAPPPENHNDLPDVLCQACHRVSTTPPPSLGHVLWRDKTCSSCHRTSLDLPVSHDDRGELTCALCHESAKVAPPSVPHAVTQEGLCASCHSAAEISVSEPRHEGWGEECMTCHTENPGGIPTVPHEMDSRAECGFCHRPGDSGQRHGLQFY